MGIRDFRIASVFLLLFLGISAAGRGFAVDTSLETVKKAGKLVIACDASYPPMEFEGKDGKIEGFTADLARAIGKKMGVEAKFMTMNWDGILAGLKAKRYDVIMCTMNVTPERSKEADFVEYVRLAQVYVVRKGEKVESEKDLPGKVVAVQADTTSYSYVKGLQDKGLKIKEIKAFRMATDVLGALKIKQADVGVLDEPVGRYYAKQGGDKSPYVVSGIAMKPEPVGIAIRKTDLALKEEISKALQAVKADGTMKKIEEQWFGGALAN